MVEMAITEPTVAFLGPLGTYSHQVRRHAESRPNTDPRTFQAVKQYFGPTIRLMPRPTIHSAAMTLLSAPKPDFALIPIRNSTAGPVAETEAILADRTYTSEVKIVDKTKLKVRHCLLARRLPPGRSRSVEKIFSHEQARHVPPSLSLEVTHGELPCRR